MYLEPSSGGSLAATDLAAHPEVKVVHDQAALESALTTRVAIWVDKRAVGELDDRWIVSISQQKYPVAVVGAGDSTYAFFDLLPFGGSRPYGAVTPADRKKPGFSVWMVTKSTTTHLSAVSTDSVGPPTVDAILDATDSYLSEGQR